MSTHVSPAQQRVLNGTLPNSPSYTQPDRGRVTDTLGFRYTEEQRLVKNNRWEQTTSEQRARRAYG